MANNPNSSNNKNNSLVRRSNSSRNHLGGEADLDNRPLQSGRQITSVSSPNKPGNQSTTTTADTQSKAHGTSVESPKSNMTDGIQVFV